MRVSRERAAENRARMLSAAAKLFREKGFSGVGMDALADEAGLSHGSLYSQFGSKAGLAAEALEHALNTNAEHLSGMRTFEDYVARYLCAEHRDRPGDGCALAALGGDVSREGPDVRRRFTSAVRQIAHRIAGLRPAGRRSRRTTL
ncbi:MAG: helix-turn-helix domain-containing protein [Burkholderiaceae bacterium]